MTVSQQRLNGNLARLGLFVLRAAVLPVGKSMQKCHKAVADDLKIDVAKLLEAAGLNMRKGEEVSKSFESTLLGFGLSRRLNATLADCIREILYQFTGVFPTDARVCDA